VKKKLMEHWFDAECKEDNKAAYSDEG